MTMAMLMSEENLRRRLVCMEDGEAPEVRRRVKRRKRDTENEVDPPSAPTTVKRSSRFRGVSKHRWTGRYEAHLWDKLSWNVTRKKKGKQGAYDDEEAAARAYDLAALKYWGTSTFTNFPISDYEKQIDIMQTVTKEEYLASLRRKSSGFSRGVSKYRGVARHHHNGRWEARIGRVFGNQYLYLGTYSSQEEAARAYDIAAIEYRGTNAITNFDLSTYIRWSKPESNTSIPAQEQKPNLMTHKKLQASMLQTRDFSANNLIKQERFEQKIPVNSCRKSSSPTAVDLLLRSSMFRELVQKNSNFMEDENGDGENTKELPWMVFCDGPQDFPFVLSADDYSIDFNLNYDFPSMSGSNMLNVASIY
ncbi:Ethylene-responsive transcription factor WRI1 [Abeliophyllum distichum]|uniref:Ethylene-responsive transcription factor WRI1 n=1 Tax=Abeliophyllum distichum TaxID=126358 RepID=A0ABD1NS11_9LAMI